jgi:hypothetical protein
VNKLTPLGARTILSAARHRNAGSSRREKLMTLSELNLRSVLRCALLVVTLLAIAAKAQLTPKGDSLRIEGETGTIQR